MLPLLALMMMGAGAKNKYDEVQADKEDRAYTLGQRERTLKQQARDDAAQAAMDDAAAPATVESAQLPGPTMPGAPDLPMVSKVKGTSYANMGDATKAANDFNAIDPVARMSDALMKSGRPMQALQLSTAGRQDQLGKLQLDEAQTAHANKLFNAAIEPLGSHDELADALNRAAPPGSPQVRPVVSADGKKVNYSMVMPDGTIKATQHEYDTTDRGLLMAKQDAMKDIPLSAKIAVLHQQAMENQSAAQLAETTRHNKAVEANQGDLTAAKVEMASMRAAAAKGSGGVDPVTATPESTFDRKTASGIAADTVKKEAENAALSGKPMTGAQMAMRTDEIVNAMYQQHTNRFIEQRVRSELGAAQDDPTAYAATYAKASKLVSADDLAKMGFKPPSRASGKPATTKAPPQEVSMSTAAKPVGTGAALALPIGMRPSGNAATDRLLADNLASLKPLNDAVAQAKAQLAAAAKSGDPRALQAYASRLTAARAQRDGFVRNTFGNDADAYLQNLD